MILNGKEYSDILKEDLKNKIENEKLKLKLCVIQIGNDEASNIYIAQKEKLANYLNIGFWHLKFNEEDTEETIENEIIKLNKDDEVTGIIIQLPIPNKFNKKKLINLINPNKDVDGLTDINKIKLINNEDGLIPCTPKGIIELLKHYNISIKGKNIVIIGRSDLVSKPLADLFLNMDGTVTLCHSKTKDISLYSKNADILVCATGKSKLITKDLVKEGSIIIDVGISRINNKLSGDVDYENVKDSVSYITPVPGGVGPMTVIMLMVNVYEANKKLMKSH